MTTASTYNDPGCRRCELLETECAWLRGQCCGECTHFADLDADGNTIFKPAGRKPKPRPVGNVVQLHPTRRAAIDRALEALKLEQQAEA